jgi:hypothetical protein
VCRGDLPRWAWWLETLDDRLPGGSEPYVMRMFDKFGFFITSFYWLGLRNQLQAASVWFGIPVSAAEVLDSDKLFFAAEGVWRVEFKLGQLLKVRVGWEIVNYGPGKSLHTAMPYLTLKRV